MRMYFLITLKRSCVPAKDIWNFYCICIRPLLEYSQVFHHSLPEYLSNYLEQVQKKASAIISPCEPYNYNLQVFSLALLQERRLQLYQSMFSSIMSFESHKLHNLLPPKHEAKYNIRNKRVFNVPLVCTNRFKRTFIPTMYNF